MRDIRSGYIPDRILNHYRAHNWRNAAQILCGAYPQEWNDIIEVLGKSTVYCRDVSDVASPDLDIADGIDAAFEMRGWGTRVVERSLIIGKDLSETRSHRVRSVKGRVGLEIECARTAVNSIRDLDNFRELFEIQFLDVGIVIVDAEAGFELMTYLVAGEGGSCPILVFEATATVDPWTM